MIKKFYYQLKFKSISIKVLTLYSKFIIKILTKLKITYTYITLPTRIKYVTVLKSPHVYKKAREQFQLKIFKVVFKLSNYKINNQLLKYFYLNKPNYIKLILKKIA